MKITTQILNILLLFAGLISAQQAPYLSSPRNNEKYVRTEKLVLSWYEIEDVEGYQVQIALNENFTFEDIIFSGKSNSAKITVSELSQNTSYWWRVRVDSPGSPWSDIWKFTTTVNPRPVTLINPIDGVNNLGTDVVVFTWSSDSANASFNFQLSNEPDFSDTLRNINTEDNFTELTNLGSGQQYYWRVKPYNSDELPGQWSNAFSFRTQLRKASLLTPANYSNNQDTAITFKWAKVNLASIYDFQLGLYEDFETLLPEIDTSTTFDRIKIDAMLSDTVYFWRVKSRNSFNDTSKWSEPFTFRTKLGKPSLIFPADSARNIELNNVGLEWKSGNLFDTYRVQIALDTLFKNKIADMYVENNSVVLPGLENNTFYYWRVNRRTDSGDTSYWSDYSRFKTRLSIPESILPVNNATSLSRKILFTWHPVDSAEVYELKISESSSSAGQITVESTEDTSLIIDELEINKEYIWQIRAVNSFGDTSHWNEENLLYTSRFLLQPQGIDTLIDFSKTRVDTIASVDITNGSDAEAAFNNIIVIPDSIFSVNRSSLSLAPLSSGRLFLTIDESRIDTGLTAGLIKLPPSVTGEDTISVNINLYARMAVLGFTDDTLFFDSTNSSNAVTKSFRLNNRHGNITLDLENIYFEGDEEKAFELIDYPDKIATGDSALIKIQFDPIKLDINKTSLILTSNSFPDDAIRIPVAGLGKGGQFSDATLQLFDQLKATPFEGLVNSSRNISIVNTGNLPIEYKVSFSEKYFELLNKTTGTFRLQPGDSGSIDIHYITPNFSEENIDTLIITHNAVGESPLKFILNGVFDSTSAANKITNAFKISGKQLSEISDGMITGENTSIRSGFSHSMFEDESNLIFRMNYFTGGPGSKKTAVSANSTEFVIPYQNVNENGLMILGELYTKGSANEKVDSISIFGPIDVQVVLENYQSGSISVMKSTPGENAAKANTNWVLFGFPFDGVIADSVFNDLGQTVKMEDGLWIVYQFDSSTESGFAPINSNSISSGEGYFIAQSIMESFDLSYAYKNAVTTRRLSDNTIELDADKWKTITNPYTFDVEIDTPAVVYRYDTGAKSYKLTNIMRPGEGYFVPPEISQINLKNYGEYYPVLFPKVIATADWSLGISIESESKTEELYAINTRSNGLRKCSEENLVYRKAPAIDNSFDAGFISEDSNKYSTAMLGSSLNSTYNIYLTTEKKSSFKIDLAEFGDLPEGISYKLFDYQSGAITNGNIINVSEGHTGRLLLAIGTDWFIQSEIRNFELEVASEYRLFQNYPNPFNPTTVITYRIPASADKSASARTLLSVFDVLGREVAVLVNERQEPGLYSVEFNAGSLPSGVYFYRMISGNYSNTKKLILLK